MPEDTTSAYPTSVFGSEGINFSSGFWVIQHFDEPRIADEKIATAWFLIQSDAKRYIEHLEDVCPWLKGKFTIEEGIVRLPASCVTTPTPKE